ncbi:MAG: glycosyltransferase [Pseudomonadota bacterium]
MKPKVSIIMPVYNGAKYIGDAIDSVVKQTYEHWELIVIDDASTDETPDIIKSWEKWINSKQFDSNLILWSLRKNSGSPVAPRNAGLGLVKGKYTAFLDSDDFWSREKLERQVKFMEWLGVGISYHDLLLINGRKEKWSQLSKPFNGNCFRLLLFKNFIPNSSVMVRTDLIKKYRYDARLTISHDWDLLLKLAHETEVGYIPFPLGFLRMHEGSVISKVRRRRKESREVVRRWKDQVPLYWYLICLFRYYLVETYDIIY